MKKLTDKINTEIHKTPTGELRNLLTDINILALNEHKLVLDELLTNCDILIEANEKLGEDWCYHFVNGVYAVKGMIQNYKSKKYE